MQEVNNKQSWLFGRTSDILFGCGLIYVPILLLMIFQGETMNSVIPLELTPIIALILSVPHYGSTLVRVYEKKEERQKYSFFSTHLSILILIWFVYSVYSSVAGSLLLTLYLCWSPWHYMGQNYGVGLMFLARRGIKIPSTLKKTLHISFVASFLLALIELQSQPIVDDYYQLLTFELSNFTRDALYSMVGAIYIFTTAKAISELRKLATFKALLPTLLIMFSQALWFLVPLLMIRFNFFQDTVAFSARHSIYAFFWIAITHAIQYLWITGYYAKKDSSSPTLYNFYSKALFAGGLIWIAPALVFAPGFLGNRPFDFGLSILIASAVNVHHFMLDGAIWKLRNGRIASILLKNTDNQGSTISSRAPVGKYIILSIGLVCVVISYISNVTYLNTANAIESKNSQAALKNISTLKVVGRDNPYLQSETAMLLANERKTNDAIKLAQEAVSLTPNINTWSNLSTIYEKANKLQAAKAANNEALKLNPQSEYLLKRKNYLDKKS